MFGRRVPKVIVTTFVCDAGHRRVENVRRRRDGWGSPGVSLFVPCSAHGCQLMARALGGFNYGGSVPPPHPDAPDTNYPPPER